MKEQEPKSRAQFLEERVANSCLNYQSKHGFDTAFDLILEDVIELRKMVNSVGGETPKPDHELGPLVMERESGQFYIYDKAGNLLLTVSRKAKTADEIDPAKINALWILQTLNEKLIENVSGEAKTPDHKLTGICKICAFEWGDHKIGEELCPTFEDGVFKNTKFAGVKDDGLTFEEYFALIGADPHNAVARTIWDTFKAHNLIIRKKELTGGSVPTPSDHDIKAAAREYGESFKTGEWFEDIRIEAYIQGAKWLRGRLSPEQEKP